jgi:hypothetical protein
MVLKTEHCPHCGSYIITAEEIEALRMAHTEPGQHGDPVGEPGERWQSPSEIANEIINEFKELTKLYLLNLDFYPVIFKNAILYAETNIRKKYTEDNK